jgi:hypothetical protein
MFDALTRLYESKNTSRKLTLRNQLRNLMMNKSKNVSNYIMRISQIKEQVVAIGDSVDDAELLTTTLNAFPSSWDPFVQGICARSKLPKFDKLWIVCTQEESRSISKSQKTNDEENQALVAHVKKQRERRDASPKKPKDYAIRKICQKLDATVARSWDIMPFNILIKMKEESIMLVIPNS